MKTISAIHAFVLALTSAAFLPIQAAAKTVYVDRNFGPGGIGSQARPYDTINRALADFEADTIIVMPGVYQEQLVIKKNIRILGYDGPHTTILDGSMLPADAIVVNPDGGLDVTIEGLKISGARVAVRASTNGKMFLRNVVTCDSRDSGVWVYRGAGTDSDATRLTMVNCVLFGNGHGLLIYQDHINNPPWVTVFNCAFVGNENKGVELFFANTGGTIRPAFFIFDYNVAVGNEGGNYHVEFAPGKSLSRGANSFEADPMFAGGDGELSSKDFRLTTSSALRDKGKPDLGFLDPDGTRNDIGAYGGPGARTFYTNPNDGPMIREVTVDKGVVPKGETFTIRAKAAVR